MNRKVHARFGGEATVPQFPLKLGSRALPDQMFGIGIYLAEADDDEVSGNTRPTPTTSRTNGTISENQLKLIKQVRTEMGMEPDEVQNLAIEMFKVPVTGLNKTQASTFIQSLKVAKQNGNSGEAHSSTPF